MQRISKHEGHLTCLRKEICKLIFNGSHASVEQSGEEKSRESFLCTELYTQMKMAFYGTENGSTQWENSVHMKTYYTILELQILLRSLNFIQKAVRESLNNISKGSERIRFVLQESFIEKPQDLVTTQTGKMGNEGREKFRAIPRFLIGLIIPPLMDTEEYRSKCKPEVKWEK